jgi:hypothetical protein
MRFAVLATTAAAAVAIPFAVAATGPQMSGDQFVSEVRCVAYQDTVLPHDQVAQAKYRLNAEARRQPAETAAIARAEASSIAREAVNGAAAANGSRIGDACATAQLATGADSPRAV